MKKLSSPNINKPARMSGLQPGTLAIAISGCLLAGLAQAEEKAIELDKLNVEEQIAPDTNPYAVPGAPYLSNSADPRRTRPLAETPATITVLTAEEIKDTGRSDLREILDGQPGITLGTGENGNAFGDRYVIRGHEARSDVFVDGLRDPGMTIRESFATEQIEITKGPSSTFAGRGSTGGAVNSVTKQANSERDFTLLDGGVGTDSYYRLTLDANKKLSESTALRLNVLAADEDVPDRAPAGRERQGMALALTHRPSDRFQISADYYHLDADDKPDLGTYLIDATGDGNRNAPVDDIPVYLQKEDFLKSRVDTLTVRAGYAVSDSTRIINLTRYGTTDNGYVVTGARGTTGYASEDEASNSENGFDTATLSTHQGWQEVESFANQLSLVTNKHWGALDHELIATFEYSDQKVLNGLYAATATGSANCFAAGRGGVREAYCLNDVNGNTVAGLNSLMQRAISKGDFDSDWSIKTTALSLMDTVDLSDDWTVFAGLRYDYYDYGTKAYFDADGDGTPELTDFTDTDGFWNGHLGATYRITPAVNVYATYSTSTNINGGESDVGISCGYGGLCVDGSDIQLGNPETTENLELGSKWLLADGKLLLSGALFQITKSDVMEQPSGDSYSTIGSLNTGKNRVKGIELGMSGNITDKLSVQLGLTVMDSEILASLNADNLGKPLADFAEKSASIHLSYKALPKMNIGGTVTYESERFTGQPDSAANTTMWVPEYTTLDLFATYDFNKRLKARLNMTNVTDEDYYLAAYRSGAFTYIGDAAAAKVSLQYTF